MYAGSSPSSPYAIWTTSPPDVRTDPSYETHRSSSVFIIRRCMYPVSAVLTAVSTRPSRPPMVWKKNSVAVSPEKKELATKPFAAGSLARAGKMGSVRSTNPSWIRAPPTDCWPTHATICEMLRVDPLDPHVAMTRAGFSRGSSSMHDDPIVSRSRDSVPFMSASRDCSSLHPGCSGRRPARNCAMRSDASSYPRRMTTAFFSVSRADGDTSSRPMENPQLASHRDVILVRRRSARAAVGPELSRMRTYTRPRLDPAPMISLSRFPASSAPSRTTTYPSLAHRTSPRLE
jgi:hypothetical protein